MRRISLRAALVGLCAAAVAHAAAAGQETPDWADYRDPQPVRIEGYDDHAMEPFLSRDGEILFFNNRNHPAELTDLHWAQRINDVTFAYQGRIEGANSDALDGVATMSGDGRFCFVSTRSYFDTLATIYCGDWTGARLAGLARQDAVSVNTLGRVMFDAELNLAGDRLIVADGVFRGGAAPRRADLRQARLGDAGFRLAPEDDALFAAVNTDALEYAASLSSNGLMLAFTRLSGRPPFVRTRMMIARRAAADAPFDAPVEMRALRGFVEAATFSPDDAAIYYHRRVRGRFGIWRARRPDSAP